MDTKQGRFVTQEEERRLQERAAGPRLVLRAAARAQLTSLHAMPRLAVGETVELKGLPLVVERIKASGGLALRFSSKYRIGFGLGDRVRIKEVEFRVTWQSGDRLGLKMVKA